MRYRVCILTALLALGVCGLNRTSLAQVVPSRPQPTAHPILPGLKADGSVLLPNEWSLRPAGHQVTLDVLPINIAVHPSGRFAAVLHSGYSAHQILVVDVASAKVISRTPVHEAFYGLEFSHDGKRLFCSGAGDEVVHSFDFRDGTLTHPAEIRLHAPRQRAVPAGLAVNRKSNRLFVANVWGDRVTEVELGARTNITDIVLGTNSVIALAPPPTKGTFDDEAANKREEASLYQANPADNFPYTCCLDEKHQRLYVSLWAQAAVAVIDLNSNQVIARWSAQEHPCEMALTRSGKLLFVANSCRNTVTVLDTTSGKTLETMNTALYPAAPRGSTPNSLTLSPDEQTLFVANADNNNVAVFDVSQPGKSRSLGFIPVGWYPTSVRVTPDGKHLLVANGKGNSSLANPNGPQPGVNNQSNLQVQYIARLFPGTLSIIDLPRKQQFEQAMHDYTAQAYRCSPLKADASVPAARPADSPIPARVGDASPLKYCIYIIKENRTYDQMLGDMPEGNGAPALCLFPEKVTPNHHQIARDFVLLDNFYVNAEVSAQGHEWSTAAYCTDFVEKMWPLNYGHNKAKKFPYPAEGYFPIACPTDGYIWDRAQEAGVSFRSYGEFVSFAAPPDHPTVARIASLRGRIDPWFRGFDLNYSDLKRANRFISELKRFETEGDMPRLQIVRLPSDHTHGTSPGHPTPTAYVAENDLALGQVVEAVTHSKFWPQTAIFVLEDDAQNGPDHVDAHRSIAFVVSPYTRRNAVDSTMYSTTSMLRTMELILGLKPMSQFDAAATPMFNAFQTTPELRPYQALPAQTDLGAKNPTTAWGGHLDMNFAKEDACDDLLLNEVIWRSVRGADHPMPAPVHAAFVRTQARDDD